jgi:cytochrome c556
MSRLKILLGGIIAASLVAIAASDLSAQMQGTELVKQRKKEMGQMSKAFGPLIQIVKGENENYDAALASAEIMNVNAKKIIANFPLGTGRDAVPDSRAKPEVWTKRAEFQAAAAKMVLESDKLIDAAKSKDLGIFRTQFKAYGAACGACHDGPKKSGGKFRFEVE